MSLDQATFQAIRDVVQQESAIALADGKEYLVESRLKPLIQSEGLSSLAELAAALAARPRVLTAKVVEALTTNETSFFRDIYPFEALRDAVLPELVARNGSQRRIDVWSAASSSGQEPISIAITILENYPELRGWDVRILATDINEVMLERCRSGLYTELEASRGLSPELKSKYFRKEGSRWKATAEVLSMIEYRQLNLATPLIGMPRMDLVFLRNVLIYFDHEAKARILSQVYSLLKPNCTLFLGTAESVAGLHDAFLPGAYPKATAFRTAS